jgi:predicted PurR-regulated permease PerM
MSPKPSLSLPPHTPANTRSFFVLLFLVLISSYLLLKPYFSIIFLGFIAAWAFKPVYLWFFHHLYRSQTLAITLTIILLYLTILLPIGFMINAAISQTILLSRDLNNLVTNRSITIDTLIHQTNLYLSQIPGNQYRLTTSDLLTTIKDTAQPLTNFLVNKAINLTRSTPELLTRTLLFTIIVISFLPHTDRFIIYLKHLSPLDNQINDLYIRRILAMTSSMIKGTFIVSLVQAAVATFILWLVNVNYLSILFITMTLLGIIPTAGTSLIMLPIGVFLLLSGSPMSGLFVLITTILIVSNLDNILRPLLLSKDAQIHPALIILGVFAGIQMFGIWGAIYGPVLIIILLTTLEIYTQYYSIKPQSK